MPLNPAEIPQFAVIRIPVSLLPGRISFKRFVVISHFDGFAYCLKTTSQTEPFDADSEQLKGVVAYADGECKSFGKRTIIDPRNQFPIAHDALIHHDNNGEYEYLGVLPEGFKERLIEAVKRSSVIEHNKKKRLLSQLG